MWDYQWEPVLSAWDCKWEPFLSVWRRSHYDLLAVSLPVHTISVTFTWFGGHRGDGTVKLDVVYLLSSYYFTKVRLCMVFTVTKSCTKCLWRWCVLKGDNSRPGLCRNIGVAILATSMFSRVSCFRHHLCVHAWTHLRACIDELKIQIRTILTEPIPYKFILFNTWL